MNHFGGAMALLLVHLVLNPVLLVAAEAAPRPGAPPAVDAQVVTDRRCFLFTYAATIKDLKPGEPARVWVPMASTNDQQDVTVVAQRLPGDAVIGREAGYGNTILSFNAKANAGGEIPFEVTYRVNRREVRTERKGKLVVGQGEGTPARYLRPDAKVPVTGKPLELLREKTKGRKLPQDQYVAAKVLYDVVNNHMTYKKVGSGWGQGDSLWACDSRYGNCTDFHSLFISMARGSQIPAKFEMGFALPREVGSGKVAGYHCWAWFLPAGHGWVPVDISEANLHPKLAEYYFGNLSANRVSFSVGRDINLEPRQNGPPLNFFIYPYVEVDGRPCPAKHVEMSFSFKDIRRGFMD